MKTIPDQATRTGRGTAGPATLPVSPSSWRTGRRRRPTGEPPPLPRHLESTGVGWLVAAVVLVAVSLLVFAAGRYGHGISLTVVDTWVLERLTAWRSPAVTGAMEAVAGLLGSLGTVKAVGAAVLLVLVAFRRFRHLLVAWASLQVVTVLVLGLSILVRRPRPFGVPIEGDWASWAMPSRPVAYLAAILVAMLYTLVPTGRWRQAGKWAATGLVTLLGLARLYLGVDHPSDVLVAAALGVTIPLLAFRWFTPNEVFPIAYRRGRAAHLDVGGARGRAIRRALAEQLGLEVTEIKPFGLSGSAGSTPLRITVKGGTVLFGKLYARSHLRADRWYKLGRELLYGRLEDEKPFHTVRRLVQQEDYALHKLHAAGLPTPRPYGFVELTPDWEYLLVTEFFAGATELGEAEVDQGVIDDGLMVVRKLWEAGLAHRDIKPANLLVRDGRVLLIDVAFAEARPSPWRQAVDLANMMLCLALRSNPELVYRRALHQFSAADISEGLAATRGLAMPSQLRHLLRERGRDLHAEFLDLLPQRPRPVSIQRWNLRRVGLALVAALGLVLAPLAVGWTARTDDRMDNSLFTRDVSYTSQEPLWLMAQSVPSAALVPCVQLVPAGWTLADVRVQKGFSQLTFDTDRAGKAAVVVELTASVDLAGAVEVTSEQPGARRYLLVDRDAKPPLSSRVYVFDGGAIAIRFTAPTPQQQQRLAGETSSAIGFTTRQQLRHALSQRTDGRLHLDPPAAP